MNCSRTPNERIDENLNRMKPTRNFALLLLFSGCLLNLQAQDKIVKRDGGVILCKVLEVGSEEIRYSLEEYDFQVNFSILKRQVDRILFENGKELVIDHAAVARESAETNSADLFLVQNKNAVKLNFLSPIRGVTNITYERAIQPGQSFEAGVGIIGLGFEKPGEPAGIGIKAGYKFIQSPDHYLQGMRYAHILKGSYVKPELLFTAYQLRDPVRNINKFALLLNLGKQWVYSDVFLVDLYFGFGYGFTDTRERDDEHYFMLVGESVPLTFNGGLRIGFLF